MLEAGFKGQFALQNFGAAHVEMGHERRIRDVRVMSGLHCRLNRSTQHRR